MNREAITIMQACALVSVSRRTMYNWIAAGKVEVVRVPSGRQRIYVDSLWRTSSGTKIPIINERMSNCPP